MSLLGSNITQSIAQLNGQLSQAAKAATKTGPRSAGVASSKPRAEDQFLASTSESEPTEGVKSIKSNDQEESHDDHQRHHEERKNKPSGNQNPKPLDLSA